ncbi:uncharacterized protein [Spinacia oleracea]|uniref:DUF4283 domain-containing protein n=1 Tax=Spinacia oleracea TaxID=3562 RepID=A0A9R0HT74_SPIOL|nr:uncharacterized protein LOC110776108 [Spinacia oleracea]
MPNSMLANDSEVIINGEPPILNNKAAQLESSPVLVSIDFDDIGEEVEFWESAVVGRGIYLVRFTTMENCSKILNNGPYFFDSKPLVVKPWSADENFTKEIVKTVPIWIQLSGLDVKYWGDRSLSKIVSPVGTMMKVDQATKNKDKLMFARVMIEVKVDQDFPSVIHFQNEKGAKVDQKVNYDWIPLTCAHCGGMGHDKLNCTRNKNGHTKKMWVRKQVQPSQPVEQVATRVVQNSTSFTQATKFSKVVGQQLRPVITTNSFQALSVLECEREPAEVVEGDVLMGVSSLGRGVAAPMPNG